MTTLTYRQELDGLRAVAVMAVIFFHLDFSWMQRGYLGVDMFFVLSGFLITGIILKSSSAGKFSFRQFYLRRLRRLAPALIFTYFITFGFSVLLFPAALLTRHAGELLSSILFVSNIYFFLESGYFDPSSEFKPLLHTWSLSVEEQFYLFWPALLVLLFAITKKRNLILFALFAIGVLSAMMNLLLQDDNLLKLSGVVNIPKLILENPDNTVFFLTPFRVFEFAIGAICNFIGQERRRGPGASQEVFTAAALGLVLVSLIGITSMAGFYEQALVCLATAAVIVFAPGTRVSKVILENKFSIALGLLSYSLYLVHWPTIVFLKYYMVFELTIAAKVIALVVSILLSSLIFVLIENRYRANPTPKNIISDFTSYSRQRFTEFGSQVSPDTRFVSLVVLLCALLGVASYTVWRFPVKQSDVPEQLTKQLSIDHLEWNEIFWKYPNSKATYFSQDSRRRVLVLGDSQAADFMNVTKFSHTFSEKEVVFHLIHPRCFVHSMNLTLEQLVGTPASIKACHDGYTDLLNKLRDADEVVFGFLYLTDKVAREIVASFEKIEKLLNRLSAYVPRTRKLYVLGLKSQSTTGIQYYQRFQDQIGVENGLLPIESNVLAINDFLRSTALKASYTYFDQLDLFCRNGGCRVFTESGNLIFYERTHLFLEGAKFLAKEIDRTRAFSGR